MITSRLFNCLCGGDAHVVESFCDPRWTGESDKSKRVLYSWCRRLEVVCFKCAKRFGNWHYGTMFEDSAEYFKEDAESKLTIEWNKYITSQIAVPTDSEHVCASSGH